MRARELQATGIHCKTVFHAFDGFDPLMRMLAYSKFDNLLDESIYNFDPNYYVKYLDFSDHEGRYIVAEYLDDEGVLHLDVPHPTQNTHRAIKGLWEAAVNAVISLNVQSKLAKCDLEKEIVSDSELIFDDDRDHEWAELTEMTEHHLNLPYDRLVRQHSDLLELGGVGVNEASVDENPDEVVEIYSSPLDEDGIDPEAFVDEPEVPIDIK
ncbi:hypothetical protein [Haladaptatus sp. CMAA 1911]|uniref:hypothetical protein n=1 Tax=unclassified Haladaptatus TaxID=2622732 RepID=UPI0037546C99